MIDVVFKFEKYWVSFDVGKWESPDDDDGDMRTTIMTAVLLLIEN